MEREETRERKWRKKGDRVFYSLELPSRAMTYGEVWCVHKDIYIY